jgi:hypothetical protein
MIEASQPGQVVRNAKKPQLVVAAIVLIVLVAAWAIFFRAPLVTADDLVNSPDKYHGSVVKLDMAYRGATWGKYPVLTSKAQSGADIGFSFQMPDDLAEQIQKNVGASYRVKVRFFNEQRLGDELRKDPSFSFQRDHGKIRQGDVLSISQL